MGDSLKSLEAALDARVVGHGRVKRRLLEMAALRQRFGDPVDAGPVLVLAGPEGSGRAALGEALATGLSLPLLRVGLTGLSARDLRGAPREDGGEPGVLLGRLGSAPRGVVLLEGIDRLGGGSQAERAALVLRTLLAAGETFTDRFAGEAVSLRGAYVLATADHEEGIPQVLRELVEPVGLRGYDSDAKLAITRRHLIPRALEALGASESVVSISPGAFERLCSEYAPEAGVHSLARRVGQLIRRAAARVALGEVESVTVEAADLPEYLGSPPLRAVRVEPGRPQVGVALGLLWTHEGGEVALVEALLQGGDASPREHGGQGVHSGIRREAVESALAFLQRSADRLGIDSQGLRAREVAVRASTPPRPVANAREGLDLAVLVALTSVATDRPVRADLAAVGGVTLHGAVQPLPGLPEMVLGAARRGVRHVLLPASPAAQVRRALPASTLAAVAIEPVEDAWDAARAALIDIVIARRID
ncbi:MAG: S16 family serine protease [Planctomycetota bacterium]